MENAKIANICDRQNDGAAAHIPAVNCGLSKSRGARERAQKKPY